MHSRPEAVTLVYPTATCAHFVARPRLFLPTADGTMPAPRGHRRAAVRRLLTCLKLGRGQGRPTGQWTVDPSQGTTRMSDQSEGRFMVAVGAIVEHVSTGSILLVRRRENAKISAGEWEHITGRINSSRTRKLR